MSLKTSVNAKINIKALHEKEKTSGSFTISHMILFTLPLHRDVYKDCDSFLIFLLQNINK